MTMNRQEFDIEESTITEALSQIRSEIGQLRGVVISAGNTIQESKDGYNAALDRGDEKTMKACLARIREANENRDAAAAKLQTGFSDRIEQLRERYRILSKAVGPLREAAEVVMKAAEAGMEDVARCALRCTQVSEDVSKAQDQLDVALRQVN